MADAITVYVAGASSEAKTCARVMAWLSAEGYRIASDWPGHIIRRGGLANEGLTEPDRSSAKSMAMVGIDACDAFVLVLPARGDETRGAWWELGYAEAIGKPIVIFVDSADPSPEHQSVMTSGLHVERYLVGVSMWLRAAVEAEASE